MITQIFLYKISPNPSFPKRGIKEVYSKYLSPFGKGGLRGI